MKQILLAGIVLKSLGAAAFVVGMPAAMQDAVLLPVLLGAAGTAGLLALVAFSRHHAKRRLPARMRGNACESPVHSDSGGENA